VTRETKHDESQALEIRSPHDGTTQRAVLRIPRALQMEPLPLIIAPHPFGWSVEEDYSGGCQGLKADEHRGWRGVPSDWGIAVLQPEGHHRSVPGCSMGYEGVVSDAPAWIDAVDEAVRVDRDRVYACGLSMGALEALLMAGRAPDVFAAVFAFNPVADTRAWYEDLARATNLELRAEGSDRLIVQEVGGLPHEVPEAYEARSAFAVLDGLRRVPITIWWSHLDLVVPRQTECHGKHLYDELKRLDTTAPVSEYNHSARYGLPMVPTDDQRWAVHETSDYRFAAHWLLLHRRSLRMGKS
jgi:pimeloyl-ACP methyl ester carboxylesterase